MTMLLSFEWKRKAVHGGIVPGLAAKTIQTNAKG
jgi:hypothetical protein